MEFLEIGRIADFWVPQPWGNPRDVNSDRAFPSWPICQFLGY